MTDDLQRLLRVLPRLLLRAIPSAAFLVHLGTTPCYVQVRAGLVPAAVAALLREAIGDTIDCILLFTHPRHRQAHRFP